MGRYWVFKVFISEKGENEISDWKESFPVNFRNRIDRIIAHLEVQKDMRSRYFKSYKNYDNIYELRLKNNNIEHRPLGCFGPGRNEFTLLIPAKEVGDKLEPKNAAKTALKRCALVHSDRRYIDDYV